MFYKEIDDLYSDRRSPWRRVIAIAAVVTVAALGVWLVSRATNKEDSTLPQPAKASRGGTDTTPAPDAGTRAGGAAVAVSDSATKSSPSSATGMARSSAGAGASSATAQPFTTRPAKPKGPPYPANELQNAMAEAKVLETQDKILEARDKLLALVEDERDLGQRQAEVESRLGANNILLVTTPRMLPTKTQYVIKSGDSLSKIAAQFNCPAELIQKANGIANPAIIRPGDVLRVLDRPKFAIEISKTENWLLLTLDGRFFKRYAVGTGEFGKTPVGSFIIKDKIVEPPWWRGDGKVIPFGDKENILGTRWLALEATGDTFKVGGYGIHGTWDDNTIGKQSSAGCVRMRNPEVEELTMLVPRGTPVVIRE